MNDEDEKTVQKTVPLPAWTREFFSLIASFSEKIILLLVFIGIISFAFTGCESQRTIVNGLDEREANEIMVLLANKNINAYKIKEKEAGGGGAKVVLWDIAVDSEDANLAMATLNTYGLPRRRGQNLLELFSAGGLVPSDMQEKIRYQAGLADQIANTIRKIDGIVDADVQLSFPEEDPLNPNAPKGQVTASVYVKHTGVLDDPNSHLITKIKRLVASSVNNLNFDNVNVIPDRARFSDLPTGKEQPAQVDYVKVWSLVIAKDSVARFQTIFFVLSLLVFFLFFSACWLGWKIFPILKKRGGLGQLFHLSPLPDEFEEEKNKPAEEPKSKDDTTKPSAPKGPKVQENIENT
jgi:type III secretion protein J